MPVESRPCEAGRALRLDGADARAELAEAACEAGGRRGVAPGVLGVAASAAYPPIAAEAILHGLGLCVALCLQKTVKCAPVIANLESMASDVQQSQERLAWDLKLKAHALQQATHENDRLAAAIERSFGTLDELSSKVSSCCRLSWSSNGALWSVTANSVSNVCSPSSRSLSRHFNRSAALIRAAGGVALASDASWWR